jgi:hypothetical protein
MKAWKSTNCFSVANGVKADRTDCMTDEEVGKFGLPFASPVCVFAFDYCFVDGLCVWGLACA